MPNEAIRLLTIDSSKQKIEIQTQLCDSQLQANWTLLPFINLHLKNAVLQDKVQTDWINLYCIQA